MTSYHVQFGSDPSIEAAITLSGAKEGYQITEEIKRILNIEGVKKVAIIFDHGLGDRIEIFQKMKDSGGTVSKELPGTDSIIAKENIVIYREYVRATITPKGDITYEILKHGKGFVPCENPGFMVQIATICRDALKNANQLG